eukprot:TRINITY_DN1389_c0_g1_i1.p2 TRINITY_DN1389_c0_g1~~TRINITY_DN1389_c0_g1_i1.p2  ORF type:complete len:612 (-),score=111.15 TRINITY_DN1389_c0_g1_i1:48-1883(-)
MPIFSLLLLLWIITKCFFDVSALLITLILVGRFLEMIAKGKTSSIIANLLHLSPEYATLVVGDEEKVIDSRLVQIGDKLKIVPGMRIPTDGEILRGTTQIDESMITGESMPVFKQIGDEVIGGTQNLNGMIIVKVQATTFSGTLSNICKMVEEAQMSRPNIQRIADKISSYFVPFIITLAALVFILWFSLAYLNLIHPPENQSNFTFALLFAITVLVVSCPCAISLAVPTAVMVGTGVAAKHGVLFKTGAVLETACKSTMVVFDKTGTITTGVFQVVDVVLFKSDKDTTKIKSSEVLYYAACIETASEHPIGKSIVESLKTTQRGGNSNSNWNNNIELSGVEDFEAIPGKGCVGTVKNQKISVGSLDWLKQNFSSTNDPAIETKLTQYEQTGHTVIGVAIGQNLVGTIILRDTIKDEAFQVIRHLKNSLNLKVVLLSGDNSKTTKSIGAECGVESEFIYARQTPESKAKWIKTAQEQGDKIMMVGDGVNDSVALIQADVGVVVRRGTDITVEAAKVVLMQDSLWGVVTALDVSKETMKRIKVNFMWAFVYNVIGIPVASGMLYPIMGFVVPPALAGLSELLSSLPVVLSSLMLRWYTPKFIPSNDANLEMV